MKNIFLYSIAIFSIVLFSCNKEQTSKTSSSHPTIKGSMLVKEKGCVNCHNGKKARTFEDMAKSAPSNEEAFKQMVKGKCMTDKLSKDEFDSFADYIIKQLKK